MTRAKDRYRDNISDRQEQIREAYERPITARFVDGPLDGQSRELPKFEMEYSVDGAGHYKPEHGPFGHEGPVPYRWVPSR